METGVDINAKVLALEQTAMLERVRMDMTIWHEIRGFSDKMPAEAMAAWQVRIAHLESAAAFLKILAEPAIAGRLFELDPRLIVKTVGVVVPTVGPLWPT